MTIKSARRVVEILELFSKAETGLGLKDIVEYLGYPTSSAFNLLKSLVQLGCLDYDQGSRTYMPTLRLPELVQWVEPRRFSGTNTLSIMRDLFSATGETISLGAQSDIYAQYIHMIHSHLPVPYDPPKIVHLLARCGLGWLLLSDFSDEKIDYLVKRMNYHVNERKEFIDLGRLLDEVYKVRENGYVFSRHTVVKDGGMIGMLVPSLPGQRRQAISVHGPVDRLEEKQAIILSELRTSLSAAARAVDESPAN